MKLSEEPFTLQPDISVLGGNGEGYALYITAKRYRVEGLAAVDGDSDAITILALHSTSFHKETWEPTLQVLFGTVSANRTGKVKVREVWAIDCPNHGQAGILNQEILKKEPFAIDCGCERYAAAVHRFLMSAPKSFGIDFCKRKLVGLGHSLGANALLLLQGRLPLFPFLSLLIVEPMVSPGGGHHLDKLRAQLVEGAKRRTYEWSDRTEAYLSLKSNPRTARWDKRVLQAFVKHAISDTPSGRVKLACTPEQEQAMYLDNPGATQPVEELTRICSKLPIHLVLGLKNDFIPRTVHEELLNPESGRIYASVTQIPEVGHLIPQEIPNKLGALVYELLARIMDRPARL
ncbi:hypothetical protein AN958_07482 [Leucoagaricus sp. SymC.cos]|nr:hypothetical protein AN958_07482 [Leucoagaricus sp. SymC.cos]